MAPLMKLLFMFLLGLAFAFKSSSHRLVSDYFIPTALPQPGYASFVLALQWPPSVNPNSNLRDFTIHGLWPTDDKGFSPKRCPPAPPFVRMGTDLTDLLDKSWPDVENGNNTGFWTHEWNKHGTCSSKQFNQTSYFRLALELRSRFNVLNYLSTDGIGPGPGQTYQVQRIEKAVSKGFKNCTINMQCNTVNQPQLQEIRICLDASGTKVINCSGRVYGRCPTNKNVSFPGAKR